MKDVPVTGLLSIIFGLVVLLVPQLISYLIGLYLILIGIVTLVKRS